MLVDVIERHQQQRQPLQRLQRAAAQHQRRGCADWHPDRCIDAFGVVHRIQSTALPMPSATPRASAASTGASLVRTRLPWSSTWRAMSLHRRCQLFGKRQGGRVLHRLAMFGQRLRCRCRGAALDVVGQGLLRRFGELRHFGRVHRAGRGQAQQRQTPAAASWPIDARRPRRPRRAPCRRREVLRRSAPRAPIWRPADCPSGRPQTQVHAATDSASEVCSVSGNSAANATSRFLLQVLARRFMAIIWIAASCSSSFAATRNRCR